MRGGRQSDSRDDGDDRNESDGRDASASRDDRADHAPDRVLDHYALLGVARAANVAEVRRAFRVLALRHHPDRAGPTSTARFQRLAAAYAILSDPAARARYDAEHHSDRSGPGHQRRAGANAAGPIHAPAGTEQGDFEGPGGRIGWRRRRSAAAGSRSLPRVSGSLGALLANGIARRLPSGMIELLLAPDEAAHGGVCSVDAAVQVVCPTCGGSAEPRVLWCRRCEFAGSVLDQVTFALEIPPHVRDGLTFSFATDPSGHSAPLRIRVRTGLSG